MHQPTEQRFHTGVHRSTHPRGVPQAEQCRLLHVEIDDRLLSQAGDRRVHLRPIPSGARGDDSVPPRVEALALGPAGCGVAHDERHTAGRPGAGTGRLCGVSTLLSFAPILLWAAAVLDAMGGVLSGVPSATNAFGGLLAGSTLASAVVIAIQSGSKKGPPQRGADMRAQRVEDPEAVKGRRS